MLWNSGKRGALSLSLSLSCVRECKPHPEVRPGSPRRRNCTRKFTTPSRPRDICQFDEARPTSLPSECFLFVGRHACGSFRYSTHVPRRSFPTIVPDVTIPPRHITAFFIFQSCFYFARACKSLLASIKIETKE